MKIVQRDIIEVRIEEDAEIYPPPPQIVRGEINGKEFSMLIEESDLPTGTAASAPKNVSLITWDEAFYLSWETPDGSPIEGFDILMEDSSDNEISSVEGLAPDVRNFTFDESDGVDYITNGNQYSFVITTVTGDLKKSASEVVGTPSDKTPQNLSQTINEDNESELSWDSVSGDVIGYRIKIKDSDTGDILNTVGIIVSTSHTFTPTAKGFLDIVVVAVSTKDIFESAESNTVNVYNNESITGFEVSLSGTNDFSSSWDSLASAAGYNLYRKPPNGSYEKVNDSLIGTNSYSESDVLWKNGDHTFYVVPVSSGVEGLVLSEIESISINNIIGIADLSGSTSFNTTKYSAEPIEETEDLSNSITHSEQVN